MRDPVMDDFGHTYERRALKKAGIYSRVSPITREEYPSGEPRLQTNYAVKAMVDEYLEIQGRGGGEILVEEEFVEEEEARPTEPARVSAQQLFKGKSIASPAGASDSSHGNKPKQVEK
eukprot:1174103-Prorocentrum_minimum.AAC.1